MKSITGYLSSLSYKFGKAPTLLYFIAYLSVIFIFTLIYYFGLQGKHFYHSTAQYEYQFFKNDAEKILNDLRAEIIQGFLSSPPALGDWKVDIDSPETITTDLNVANYPSQAEVSFLLQTPIKHTIQGKEDLRTHLKTIVTISLRNGKYYCGNDKVCLPIKLVDLLPYEDEKKPSPIVLFPNNAINGQFYEETHSNTLQLSPTLYGKIIAFGNGYQGFPTNVSGQFWRMLYLSTGIATANAFGDIVPVSTQARVAVTLEAILSITTIGLFLNSLAYDFGKVLKDKKRPIKWAAGGGDSAASQAVSKHRKNTAPKPKPRPPLLIIPAVRRFANIPRFVRTHSIRQENMETHWLYKKTQKRAETIKILAQMITGIVMALLLIVKLIVFLLALVSISINSNTILDYLGKNNVLDIIGEGLAISAGIELIYMFFTDGPDEAVQPLIYGVASAVLITLSNEKSITPSIALIVLILSVMLLILFYIKREFFPPKSQENTNVTSNKKESPDIKQIPNGKQFHDVEKAANSLNQKS